MEMTTAATPATATKPTASTPHSAPRSSVPPAPPPARGWGLPLVVLIAGVFVSVLDTSIVNVAMTVIRKDFGVSAENVQWISTVYSLTEGVVVPASAWLGARFGLKRLYIVALALFTVGSVLCALAGGLGVLIFFRIVQAVPGGILPVTAQTILYRMIPREKLGVAMGLYGVGVVVAPALGPAVGGYLIDNFSWHAIFYINVPVGILGVLAAIFVLREFPTERNRPFDLPGFTCIAGALFALLLALEEGSSWGWTSYPVLILFAVAANLLVLFVAVELQVEHPILDVRVLMNRTFVNSLLLIAAMSVGLFVASFYVPLFLQGVQGFSALEAGLTVLPQGLTMAVLMPIAGQLYDRFGARWLAIAGLLLTGTGLLMLADIQVNTPRIELITGLVVMSAGLGLSMMPVMTGGLSSLPTSLSDVGSAFNTLTMRVSSALGLAMISAMVTADRAQFWADRSALMPGIGADVDPRVAALQQQGQSALTPMWQEFTSRVQTETYSNAFFVSAAVAFAGVVLAFLFRSGRPASGADKPMVH